MDYSHVEIPEPLLAHAKERGIVVMAGAGVSAGPPSSLPDWYELNRMIASALWDRMNIYLEPLRNITDGVRALIDGRRSGYSFPPDYQAQILEENSGEQYFRALQSLDIGVRNSAHEGIAWLAKHNIVRAIVTTNFDRLLERALDAHSVPFEAAYEPKTYERCLQRLQGGSRDGPLQVLKVHGSVQDPRSLIDTLKQRLLGRNVSLERCLSLLLTEHYWLFAGFSAADLMTDENYLQLLPCAAQSPGLTYVRWPGTKVVSPGERKLLHAYFGKASVVVAELDLLFQEMCQCLRLPSPPIIDRTLTTESRKQVESALASWAASLHPAAVINCLAAMVEANDDALGAFQLLERFWTDVLPQDRSGHDFELHRLYHGRLGIGGGMLSMVTDLDTTAGEESIQNLLRRGHDGDARALAWAGLAWLWAGDIAQAWPYLQQAGAALEQTKLSTEEIVDVFTALAESLYVLGEPEGAFSTYEHIDDIAAKAGDLPRYAKLTTLTALFYAEFITADYPTFFREHTETVLERTKRLNNPEIAGFKCLAQGRYLNKQHAGAAAVEALSRAEKRLGEAGRPPWQIYCAIERAKALFDDKRYEDANDLLNSVNKAIDRYPVWLVWLEECRGQLYNAIGHQDEARQAFEKGIGYATQMGLNRRAQSLQQYLQR